MHKVQKNNLFQRNNYLRKENVTPPEEGNDISERINGADVQTGNSKKQKDFGVKVVVAQTGSEKNASPKVLFVMYHQRSANLSSEIVLKVYTDRK